LEPDGAIRLIVTRSERGRQTKTDEIIKALKRAGRRLKEAVLDKALKVFALQSEVDFFINKDARGFLREELDLWMCQYVFREETRWAETRLRQLQILKSTALRLVAGEREMVLGIEPAMVRSAELFKGSAFDHLGSPVHRGEVFASTT
jgi:adenine-specific DNA-methyltransferase